MQENNGYIKLYRKLVQWGWYQDNAVKCLFLHCLLMASYRDFKWMGQEFKAGQFITSVSHLSKELGFSTQQIRTALRKLESTEELTSKSTNKYTVITVMNWGNYQFEENNANKESNNRITNEQQTELMNKLLTTVAALEKSTNRATSKNDFESLLSSGIASLKSILATSTLTNGQQTNNKQITNEQQHLKNNKNNKNIKNSSTGGCAAQLSEILAYISENGLNVNGKDFYEHYSLNGWKTEGGKPVKDWKKLLRVWDAKELRKKPVYSGGYAGVKKLTDD